MPLTIVETTTPIPLTTIVASGLLTAEEIKDKALDLCRGPSSPLVLWDGTAADISALALKDLYGLFYSIRPFVSARDGGRTALLTSTPAAFGIGRWISTMAELSGFAHPIRPFRDREAAIEWLMDGEARHNDRDEGAGVA